MSIGPRGTECWHHTRGNLRFGALCADCARKEAEVMANASAKGSKPHPPAPSPQTGKGGAAARAKITRGGKPAALGAPRFPKPGKPAGRVGRAVAAAAKRGGAAQSPVKPRGAVATTVRWKVVGRVLPDRGGKLHAFRDDEAQSLCLAALNLDGFGRGRSWPDTAAAREALETPLPSTCAKCSRAAPLKLGTAGQKEAAARGASTLRPPSPGGEGGDKPFTLSGAPNQVMPAHVPRLREALRESIRAEGKRRGRAGAILVPVEYTDEPGAGPDDWAAREVLDGHTRLELARELGVPDDEVPRRLVPGSAAWSRAERQSYARIVNSVRRQLADWELRAVIAAELAANPSASSRSLAKMLGAALGRSVSKTTVEKERRAAEERGDVPRAAARVGADGRAYDAARVTAQEAPDEDTRTLLIPGTEGAAEPEAAAPPPVPGALKDGESAWAGASTPRPPSPGGEGGEQQASAAAPRPAHAGGPLPRIPRPAPGKQRFLTVECGGEDYDALEALAAQIGAGASRDKLSAAALTLGAAILCAQYGALWRRLVARADARGEAPARCAAYILDDWLDTRERGGAAPRPRELGDPAAPGTAGDDPARGQAGDAPGGGATGQADQSGGAE